MTEWKVPYGVPIAKPIESKLTKKLPDLGLEDTCKEALDLITGDRNNSYGDPYDNFNLVSKLLRSKTGLNLTPSNLVQVLICLKEARQAQNHKQDNLVDIIGYTSILAYVMEREKEFLQDGK